MFTFIDSLDDLIILDKELSKKYYLGVDTEFRRTNKENMKLALLQINDGEEIYLIDSVLIEDPEENCSFLDSSSVIKIFHSCKEDLEAVYSWTGKKMKNIFDTQLANSLLGGDFSISYQSLVKQELSIDLEKNETRSNWLRRPLTDSQLKYATLDVEYLIHLYLVQKEELKTFKKSDWLEQDVNKLIDNTFEQNIPDLPLERSISKQEEIALLNKFNKIIEDLSNEHNINSTLFFSKKFQKDFLRSVFLFGIEGACKNITNWRAEMIRDKLFELVR